MTIYRDQLQAVYKLIERPEAWTRGYWARDSRGHPRIYDEPDATCWCLGGAARVAIPDLRPLEFSRAMGVVSAIDFNDAPERTHDEVLALLGAAIERAPTREIAP